MIKKIKYATLALILISALWLWGNDNTGKYGPRLTWPGSLTFATLDPVAEMRAEGFLYRGNYLQVEHTLGSKILSEKGMSMLIRAKLARGEYSGALGLIYRINPELWHAFYGLYQASQGRAEAARTILTPVSAAEQGPGIFKLGLAKVLLKQGDLAGAGEILAKLKAENPIPVEALALTADMAMLQGDFPAAWENYTQAVDRGYLADDPVFNLKLGIAGIGADRDITAVVERIRSLDPKGGLADYLLAQSFIRQNNLSVAKDYLNKSLALDLPGYLRQSVEITTQEVTARLNAESTLQAIYARGGH